MKSFWTYFFEILDFKHKSKSKKKYSTMSFNYSMISTEKYPVISNYTFNYRLENPHDLETLSIHIEGILNGQKYSTSKITKLYFDRSLVMTDSGTYYKLNSLNLQNKKYYNNNIQFMINKGILQYN